MREDFFEADNINLVNYSGSLLLVTNNYINRNQEKIYRERKIDK